MQRRNRRIIAATAIVLGIAVYIYVIYALLCFVLGGEKPVSPPKKPDSLGREPRVKLRQKFLPGKYEMVQSMVQDQVMRVRNQTQKQYLSQTQWFEVNASQPDDSGQTNCVITTKRIRQSGTEDSFDTDNPASLKGNRAAQMLSRMLNYKFVLKFGPDGELISASGMDQMWDDLARQQPMAADFAQQMKETMGDEGAQQMFSLAYDMMPDEPVGLEAVWHKTTSIKAPFVGTMQSGNECELTRLEQTSDGKIAYITYTGQVKSRKGGKTEVGVVSMTFKKLDLKQEGHIELNVDTGLMNKQTAKISGDIETSIKDPRGKQVSTKATVNMTVETTIKPTFAKEEAELSQSQVARAPQKQEVIRSVTDAEPSRDKLDLSGTQTTDADLARRLEGLTSLGELKLQDTNITDAGLAHLKGLTSLRTLYLGNTQVTDTGLVHLKNLTALENLCVHKTQVTDAGLAHLKNLTSLQSLCLHDTQVSDAGIVYFKGLTLLRRLNLSGTNVSSDGLLELKEALPNCRISGPSPSTVSRAESPLIGKAAPSFTLRDLSGKRVSLSDFKGKVILLDFWATWCGPCVQTIPHLEALHKKYKDQGLAVIGINHERDHAKVRAFAKERISYVVLLDADEQFTEYGIRGIPTLFYVDRQAKVRYRDVGFGRGKEKDIERKVKELLGG